MTAVQVFERVAALAGLGVLAALVFGVPTWYVADELARWRSDRTQRRRYEAYRVSANLAPGPGAHRSS